MRILGLDLGTTSVGFALIEHNQDRESGTILRMGVRIFPEGVSPGAQGKKRETRNAKRRSARLMRRQLRRRRWRRRELGALLNELGLLPAYGSADWRLLMTSTEPYDLRRAALERALTAPELGRALYHLHKRRGFSGGRLTESTENTSNGESKPDEGAARRRKTIDKTPTTSGEEDTATIKAEIESLRRSVGGSTLGSYLAGQERKRRRHLGRDQVEAEFDRIVEVQAAHHPDAMAPANRARLRATLFEQRPTFWRRKTLGNCPLLPGEALCAKGSWIGQQFVALEHLNKLRITGQNARPLDETERRLIYALLMNQRNVTFGGIRKALKAHWRAHDLPKDAKFNLEREDKGIPGNSLEAKLRDVFGAAWEQHPARDAIRRTLAERLYAADYREAPGGHRIEIRWERESKVARSALAAAFRPEWQLSAERAEALAAIEPQPGWLGFSRKAIEILLAEMERGAGVGDLLMSPAWEEWRNEHFPDRPRPTGEVGAERLPSRPEDLGDLRNPTVRRTLNEVRKVVNNLVAVHGKPDLIRVELARELRKSGERRAEMERQMRERERERRKAKNDLEENGLANPSGADIEKWLLWKECHETCPYTGRKIGFRDLFVDNLFQVEHIFPLSRTLDNGFANKTLCHVEINQAKGNRSPHEAFAADEDRWADICNALKSSGLPDRKAQRFVKADYLEIADGEEFAERQLRDTAYAARVVRDFLRRLYPDTGPLGHEVETCNGAVTAALRWQWGLDSLLRVDGRRGKNRDDHRHHAVDALAVALTDRMAIKRLSDWHAAERQGRRPDFRHPWPTLLDDARRAVEAVVVSHRVQRKLSGPLHEERPLGKALDPESGRERFVRRKAFSALSASEIGNIRDGALKAVVVARFNHLLDTISESKQQSRRGDDAAAKAGAKHKKAAAEKALKESLAAPFFVTQRNGVQRQVKSVRLWVDRDDQAVMQMRKLKAETDQSRKTYAELGNALHGFAIYANDQGQSDFLVMTRAGVVARMIARKSAYPDTLDNGLKLKMVVYPGDVLRRMDGQNKPEYFVVRKFNQAGRIFYKPHTLADEPRPEVSFGVGQIASGVVEKVAVDPIGRVRPAKD